MWVFYYKLHGSENLIVIGFKECKHPDKIKLHDQLQEYWKKENVKGVGYATQYLDDPFYIWPQSQIPQPAIA